MTCASCGEANRAGARFCGGCGQTLAARCPACGVEVEPGRRFCDSCGASLVDPQAAAPEARKVVTIVFADLIGSTALHERLDAESARRLMDRYHRSMGAVVEAHGGTVMQLLGDGVLAGFGVPRVAEDDAIRAVRAAVGMQQAFRDLAREQAELAGEIGLRVSVYTGEVVAGDDQTHVMGDPVNVAARLQQEARDGDVLLGESTQRLVSERVTLAPVGSFTLKGRAEPVAAFRVVSLERPAGAPAIAFVGREDELRRIRAVYDTAVATRAARLAVLLGSPGLGKSRLIDEFTRRLGDGASVLLAHCDAAGGATFAPLAEALRGLLRIDDGVGGDDLRAAILSGLPEGEPERVRIADGVAALVAGTPASPEEIFFVVRRGLAALAAVRPVVLAIDDVQWAEPLLLDLIEHLVQWGSDVPLLVLVAARPELRDTRSSLATTGGLVSEVVTLAGLDAGAATRLAANVIGAEALPAAIAGRVLATSEGNPLFVGELVRMLVHDGALKLEGDRWTAGVEVAGLEMPPTIHALLAARIERLRPEERTVLERAAVIGRHFSRAALAQLLPREISDLDARLESLRRSELVEPDTGWFLGEPVLRFHHVLIRDAAYRRLLKNTRAELHGRFADWLEARAAGAVEHDETLGWHLEQAHQHLSELGPLDAQGRALGERAARHLAAEGRRALARDDLTPAASLLERALARLGTDDPARADLALDWCEALLSAGDVATAVRAIAELGRFTLDSDRLRAWHTCFTGQLAVLTDPKALRASAEAVEAAAATLTSAGDAAGEAKAHAVHALVLAQLGKIGACEAALDKALAAARRAHDRRRANAVLAGAPVAALWGPSPVTRASGRCLDVVRVLRITQGAPAVEAVALSCQAVLETLRGRAEAARRMIASSRLMVEELGITQRVLEADLFAGLIELLEGDAPAAERCLQVAYDGLREQGLGIVAAQAAALLGRALLAQGRIAEAEAISVESESLAGDSFKAAIAWRGVRAEALAARGEHAAAIEFARAAVEIAAATDDLLDHADARQALAVALRAAGRDPEAEAEEKRAIELWEAKGATLLVERARRGAARIIEPARSGGPSAAPAQTVRRRVRPNAATAAMARSAAAVEARDTEAVAALHSDVAEYVDHPGGISYGREGFLASLRSLSKARDLIFQQEPLAVLGDSLALSRRFSSASGVASTTFDVAAYEREAINLFDVDGEARVRWLEIFASDRLGDAIARLYQRYAELLPDGPERNRAAATARSIAVLLGPVDPDRWATALAPTVEFTDHRSVGLLGFGRGAETVLRGMRTLLEVADGVANRIDDVFDLRSDAFLLRWTNLGTARDGGGAFERQYLPVFTFGSDGLATRMEWFDADRDAEALARFDELTAGLRLTRSAPSSARVARRRVRPNTATANAARLEAAVAARDADAVGTLFTDEVETMHHPSGVMYDRRGALASFRSLLRGDDLTWRHEPLATLGDSLALTRSSVSASGVSGGSWDVGAYESEEIVLIEADARGHRRRTELFASDHLGDAVARLYERYAELLPAGPARARAAATARSVAAEVGPFDLGRYAAALAPGVESVDHRILGTWSARGADAFLKHFGALFDLAVDVAMREDDILGLRSDALLLLRNHFGTERAGGGGYERNFLWLGVFGSDGLLTRIELFEGDRDTEALARFEELPTEPSPARVATTPPRAARKRERRVRPNAATAHVARVDAAIAIRDAGALPTLFSDESASVDHTTGTTWDRQGLLATWRSLLNARDPACRHEPLATLGDSLALCRSSVSGSGFSGRTLDVGAYEQAGIRLIEADAKGQHRRSEMFAPDRLGDAIVRLYERYAELLPDGPARARAASTARSVAALLGPFDPDRYAVAFAPGIEVVDRRTLGTMTARGAEAHVQNLRSWLLLSNDAVMRQDEILALQSDAYLARRMFFATDRAGGGAFERPFIQLWVVGGDGLLTHFEYFDADRAAEALARFDELTAEPPATQRRVRANAATAHAARLDVTIATRDADALPTLVAEDSQVIEHATGTTYDRQGVLASWRSLLSAREPTSRHEPLASLGDSLALFRLAMSGSGFAGRSFDIGPYEIENVVLIEVDSQGRRGPSESFLIERLGDAVARLYGRYAELLPDGPARARAAATARSVAALCGPYDLDRHYAANAPDVESVDHRTLGTWSAHGAEALLRNSRSLLEIADNLANRVDDILGLRSDAFLVHWTHLGTDRAGGGAYENQFFFLCIFGSDGLITRSELFDSGRDAEALARFDELTAEPAAERFANTASRVVDASLRAMARRDWDALVALHAPGHVFDDRRSLVRTTVEGEAYLAHLRILFRERRDESRELLATRGDRLALHRARLTTLGGTGGPAEFEMLNLIEVDASGRQVALVSFDSDALDAANAELDQRFAAGEAAPYADMWQATQRLSRVLLARDWEQWPSVFTQDFVLQDHRLLGWDTRSRDEFLVQTRAMAELAPDFRPRADHSLAINRWGMLSVGGWVGSREGGRFEIQMLSVMVRGPDGRLQRLHTYDLDQLDAARACFAALTAELPAPARRFENAATRAQDASQRAFEARDWEAFAALYPAHFRSIDRRPLMRLELGRDELLRSIRPFFGTGFKRSSELIATRGGRLALYRTRFQGSHGLAGPSEVELLAVIETAANGEHSVGIVFGSDDLDGAYAELDARYHAGEAAPHARVAAGMREFTRAFTERDWDALAARCAPDLVVHDHRLLGWETLHGPAAYVEALRSLVELAPDTKLRLDHVTLCADGYLVITVWEGTREGGAYESPSLMVGELDVLGRIRRFDQYDLERLGEARARYAELRPDLLRIPANAATRIFDRWREAFEARDWPVLEALCAPKLVYEDRRRMNLIAGGRDMFLANSRLLAGLSQLRIERSVLATAGDRLALERLLWTSDDGEVEVLQVAEVDADGRFLALIGFDPDDRRAASAELLARDPHSDAIKRAMSDHDLDRLRAALPDDFVLNDHRRTGLGQLGKDDYITSLAALFEQAPDVIIEPLYTVAAEAHANLAVVPMFGTLAGGGAFESVMVRLAAFRGGQIVGLELFEPEDLDAARARFEALRPVLA